MEYLTVREIAGKMGRFTAYGYNGCAWMDVSLEPRKFTRVWAIPADEEKPQDHRLAQSKPLGLLMDSGNLMPLMNTAFALGHCLTAAEDHGGGSAAGHCHGRIPLF